MSAHSLGGKKRDFGIATRRVLVAGVMALAMTVGLASAGVGSAAAAVGVGERSVVGRSDAGKITSTVKGRTPDGDRVRGSFTPIKKINGQPLTSARASADAAQCEILHLVLGPLDLNLLGLEIHLNRVVLDIVAVPGPGNLLGNLLCAIAGLLDGGPLAGLLGQLRALLNQILALLNLGV